MFFLYISVLKPQACEETLALQSAKTNTASVVSAANGCFESLVDSELITFLPGGSPLVSFRCGKKSARKADAVSSSDFRSNE